MAPKKIIFDMDGLIFDSETVFMRELGAVMKDYGYTLTREHYIKTIGRNVSTLAEMKREEFGDDYPHEEISQKTRERVDKLALAGKLPVKEGIPELLAELNKKKIPCVVASSTHTKYVEHYLKAAGLYEYFDEITGGEQVSRSKPEPDIFIKALGDTRPCDALVLEDSINGIKAAHRAGIPVICIPDMVYPDDETKSLTLAVVESAFDLTEYVTGGRFSCHDYGCDKRTVPLSQIKICGITNTQDAEMVARLGVQYLGVVMFCPKSRRNTDAKTAKEIISAVSGRLKAAAVVVSPTVDEIKIIEECGFDIIQIHGDLSDEVYNAIHLPVFRAFNVKDGVTGGTVPLSHDEKIIGYVYDAAEPGSGRTFDWSALKAMPKTDKLIVLAGGLTDDNVADAIRYVRPDIVDVSSGVENDNGIGKDAEKAERFVRAVKNAAE